MKPIRLTEEEKSILACASDEIYLEIIKGLEEDGSLKNFDCYIPCDLKHYDSLQEYWLGREKDFMSEKMERSPSDLELIQDAEKNHNFERFRVWYVLSFPEKVKRVKD